MSDLVIYVAGREDSTLPARLGLAVKGRSLGAVGRNRVKRRIRAAFARCEASGVDVVVRADGRAEGVAFQKLVEALRLSIRRATGAAM